MTRNARGYAYLELLAMVGVAALVATSATLAYRLVVFHADVVGVVEAFERLERADELWFQSGGAATYSFDDLASADLVPTLQVHADESAGLAGLPFAFELQTSPTVFSTRVADEAKAQQVVARLGAKATYAEDSDEFVVSYRAQYPPLIAELVSDHSIHATGSNANALPRLRFADGARVEIGTPCGFRDGRWHGGLAVDRASLNLAVCKRIDLLSNAPERVWQLARSRPSMPPPPPEPKELPEVFCGDLHTPYSASCCACVSLERHDTVSRLGHPDVVLVSCNTQPTCGDGYPVCDSATECKTCPDSSNVHVFATCPTIFTCGDGTVVADPMRDCQDCWDGTNIPIGDACPPEIVWEYCDDGTAVLSRTQCKTCWHGTIGPTETCASRESCDDGTLVRDRATECKTCSNGMNVALNAPCPTLVTCPCGGTAPTLELCPTVTMKSCGGGCPSVCPQEACATPTELGPDSCPDGFTEILTTGSCVIERRCVRALEPCACGGERGADDQCPPIVKTINAVTCPADYRKVATESECTIDESCVKTCPCDGGEITHPATCPPLSWKSCEFGCPDVCPNSACAIPDRTGATSCQPGYSLVETHGACAINGLCVKDLEPCPCGAERINNECPPIQKQRIPAVCPDHYQKVDHETQCTIEEQCVRECPCGGGQVVAPAVCPPVVKQRNPVSCPSGYDKVTTETECTIEESCVRTCPCDGGVVNYPATCPPVEKRELGRSSCPEGYDKTLVSETACATTHVCEQLCACGLGSAIYPEACGPVVKDELGPSMCPSDYDRVQVAEDACTITFACQRTCPCGERTVLHPQSCPPVSKTELGVASCPADYEKVKIAETTCTVTHACEYVCPNGMRVGDRTSCPTKSCPCGQPDVLDGEACPPFQKRVTGDLSCAPARGFTWFTVREDQCSVEKRCLCRDYSVLHQCWSGPDACMNPQQVWITDVNGVEQTGFVCERETTFF